MNQHRRCCRSRVVARRTGVVLLLGLFVVAVTSLLTLGILNSQASQWALASNTAELSRAEYLAEAGIQHGLSRVLWDAGWKGKSSWIRHPRSSKDRYQYSVAPQGGAAVVISAIGQAGRFTVRRHFVHRLGPSHEER